MGLLERAQTRADDLSAGTAIHNRGIDVELLSAILSELMELNGKQPKPDVPRKWLRWLIRFERWLMFEDEK